MWQARILDLNHIENDRIDDYVENMYLSRAVLGVCVEALVLKLGARAIPLDKSGLGSKPHTRLRAHETGLLNMCML